MRDRSRGAGSGKTAAADAPVRRPLRDQVRRCVLRHRREPRAGHTGAAARLRSAHEASTWFAVFGRALRSDTNGQLQADDHVVVRTVGVQGPDTHHSSCSTPPVSSCSTKPTRCSTSVPRGRRADPLADPLEPQTALFSATMPPAIRRLGRAYLFDPVMVKVATETLTVNAVEPFALEVSRARRPIS